MMVITSCRIFTSILAKKTFESYSSCLLVLSPLCSLLQCRNLYTSEFLCGGRPKSEWRRKRVPALTRLCPDKSDKFKTRKAFGGDKKTKVTRVKEGMYVWKSQDVEFRTPILDVLHNTAHKDFTEKKIMVKGTIVEIAAERFKHWCDEKVQKIPQDVPGSTDDKILQQFKSGRVLAKVSSRPGQVGKVNGYLLEGEELKSFLNQTINATSSPD